MFIIISDISLTKTFQYEGHNGESNTKLGWWFELGDPLQSTYPLQLPEVCCTTSTSSPSGNMIFILSYQSLARTSLRSTVIYISEEKGKKSEADNAFPVCGYRFILPPDVLTCASQKRLLRHYVHTYRIVFNLLFYKNVKYKSFFQKYLPLCAWLFLHFAKPTHKEWTDFWRSHQSVHH